MKLLISLCLTALAALCSSSSLCADIQNDKKMSLEFWGGYTTAGMSDVNSALSNAAPGGSITQVKDGTLLGADFLWQCIPGAPRLSLGPRIEYLFISSGKAYQGTPLVNLSVNYYVVPIMVGGKYLLMQKGDWSLNGALFVGVGLAYGQSTLTTAAAPKEQTVTDFSGSDLTELLMLDGQYRISDNTYIGLDLGYRQLSLGQMNIDSTSVSSVSSGNSSSFYAPARAPVLDTSGNKIKYDFSGMVLNIGINFKF